jgi:glycosyltransferase involved in cell wall biosynthesis
MAGLGRWFRAAARSRLLRPKGISVLMATQDEEYVAAMSIRSFLPLGDEVIVVDNGSRDGTRGIVQQLAARYPDKVRFFDRPDLPDLQHNRAFALSQARYEWVVRADSDYVCYTDGPLSIARFRQFLLSMGRGAQPEVIWVPQVNVVADFLHTGQPLRPGGYRENPERQYVLDATSAPMPRFYRRFPGFGFVRRGKRETTRWLGAMKPMTWPDPLWMHCTIKSDLNFFRRSERTAWRKLGDYATFPTLDSYIRSVIADKYGTTRVEEAAALYMQRNVLPHLEPFAARSVYPYPRFVSEQLARNPIFRVEAGPSETRRVFLGFDPERDGMGPGEPHAEPETC